jgi:hypothetical protein
LVKEYAVIERIYSQRTDTSLQREAADKRKMLYFHILEYQAKAACHFAHKTGYRTLRNALKIDDWDTLLAKVKSADRSCRSIMTVFDALDYRNNMRAIEHLLRDEGPKIEEILRIVRELLSESKRLTKEQDFSKACFIVPFYRDSDFVGRRSYIKRINELILRTRRAALVGLGGVGYV